MNINGAYAFQDQRPMHVAGARVTVRIAAALRRASLTRTTAATAELDRAAREGQRPRRLAALALGLLVESPA